MGSSFSTFFSWEETRKNMSIRKMQSIIEVSWTSGFSSSSYFTAMVSALLLDEDLVDEIGDFLLEEHRV